MLFTFFSSVREFLEEFDIVAHNNNFFEPDFSPEDLDKLPSLYHSILEDPAAVHQQVQGAQSRKSDNVFKLFPQIKFVLL